MKKLMLSLISIAFLLGCASNVRFIQTDDAFEISPKADDAKVVFRTNKIQRPHRVVGVIQAVLGKEARRPQLDALLKQKAREIGADGVMLVDYDIDQSVYMERHHSVVGHGRWKRHVVSSHPRKKVEKTASGIAVVFK